LGVRYLRGTFLQGGGQRKAKEWEGFPKKNPQEKNDMYIRKMKLPGTTRTKMQGDEMVEGSRRADIPPRGNGGEERRFRITVTMSSLSWQK